MAFKKGYKPSAQHLERLSKSHLGQKAWNRGLKMNEEFKKKCSESHLGTKRPWSEERKIRFKERMTGQNHPRWVKDRTKLQRTVEYGERRSSAYNYWRKSVLGRDGFGCRMKNVECSGRIEVHHILGWVEYQELRYEVKNGITLCHAHHPRGRAEEERLVSVLQKLVSASKKETI